ncbi:MAG: OmpH family outer membrane protein [Candidatus Azobacteroides sp.]|nr:OmpH family outer membrane protein [Candidatus Azobacteroides sp.]
MLKKVLVVLVIAFTCSFSSFSQDKFGYLNTADILQAMPERVEAQNKLDAETSKLETELNNMRDELNKKFTAFQQEQDSMSESIKAMRMKEINELDQRTQNFYDVARQDMQKLQVQLMQPIEEKIKNAIKAVGDENGYTSIIDVNAALYLSPTKMTDVSSMIKAKLGIK